MTCRFSLCRDWNVGDRDPGRSRVRDRNSAVAPARLPFSRTGGYFSTGMDTLADELNKRGVYATSHSHTDWKRIADRAAAVQGQEGRANHPYRSFLNRSAHLREAHREGCHRLKPALRSP